MDNYVAELDIIYSSFDNNLKSIAKSVHLQSEVLDRIGDSDKAMLEDVEKLFNESKTNLYNGFIVGVYGLFEEAIKKIARKYISFCLNTNTANGEKIRDEALESFAKTYSRIEKDKRKESVESIYNLYVKNDPSCYDYDLSINSFYNMKIEEFDKIATVIQIDNLSSIIKNTYFYKKAYADYNGITDEEIGSLELGLKEAFSIIDELVDRRNSIAHSGRDEIGAQLSYHVILTGLIPLVGNFVKSYKNIIKSKILFYFSGQNICEKATFNGVANKNVARIEFANSELKSDNELLVCFGNGSMLTSKINKMEIEHISQDSCPPGTKVGCELEFPINGNVEIYLVSQQVIEAYCKQH